MDAELFKLITTILGSVASLLSGYLLIVIKSRRAEEAQFRENMAQQIDDIRKQTDRQIGTFREQVDREIDRLQQKDGTLGRDIQTTRAAFAYVCGKIGQEFPQYPTNGG